MKLLVGPLPALIIFGASCGLFGLVLHPWLMNWGSTRDEQAMVLPGDDAPPTAYFTRAISIDAPSPIVWSWTNAIGQDRAGYLSNDWLENLIGADIHNTDVLGLEWQPRALGDRVPMTGIRERQTFGDMTLTTIRVLEPGTAIADAPGRFVLLPQAGGKTRLLLRESLEGQALTGPWSVVWDPVHFVMEQRMLRGVKERAEGQPVVPPIVQAVAHLGWAAAGIALLGVFVSRRGWWPWLVLPVAAVVPALMLTGDLNSVLAGFLAVGITLAGALAFGWRWWPPYLVLASGVALVLLLAPDSYATFGLLFLMAGGAVLAAHTRSISVRAACPKTVR